MRRTLEGTKRKRQNVSGFRARMATPGGRTVLNRRRAKGRHKLAIEAKKRIFAPSPILFLLSANPLVISIGTV